MSDLLIRRDLFTTKVNSTMMSINERFTYLQKKTRPAQASILTIRAKNMAQQLASAKNRRLASQMEKRLSVMAALKLKKKSIRQRLGVRNNPMTPRINDRLTLPNRGRANRGRRLLRRNRGRSLQRSQSMQLLSGGTLQRTASMQSLNKNALRRARSRSSSRARNAAAARSRGNSITRQQQAQRANSVNKVGQKMNFGRVKRFNNVGSFRQGTPGLKGNRRIPSGARNQLNSGNTFRRNRRRGGGGGGGRANQMGRGNFKRVSLPGTRNQQSGGKRGGRGRPGGRGRFGRGGGQIKTILPTKEELDKQLEQYMANTKSHLDREIDTYMKESGVNDF